jgi:hypothetical protein
LLNQSNFDLFGCRTIKNWKFPQQKGQKGKFLSTFGSFITSRSICLFCHIYLSVFKGRQQMTFPPALPDPLGVADILIFFSVSLRQFSLQLLHLKII